MDSHRYDRRGANEEGLMAESLWDEAMILLGEKSSPAGVREDCEGTDRLWRKRKVDVKARKNRIAPHCAWIELAKVNSAIGTGWGYSDKWIAQLMVYEELRYIVNVQFGVYLANDLKAVIESKVDFNKLADKGTLHQLYARKGEKSGEAHRGIMTVLHYDDLEALPSFEVIEVPKSLWPKVRIRYGYIGIK